METEVENVLFNPLFINTLQSIFPGSGEETAPRSRGVRSSEPRTLLPGAGEAESLPGIKRTEPATGSVYSDVINIQLTHLYHRMFIPAWYFTTEDTEETEF